MPMEAGAGEATTPPATTEQPTTPPAAPTTPPAETAPTTEGEKPPVAAAAETAVEYKFDMPEGFEADEASTTKFVEIAKRLQLPPEGAQELMNLAAEREQARIDDHKALVSSWAETVKGDKELGGDKLADNLATAKQVYSLLPAKDAAELRTLLDSTGIGNHPAVFRLFLAIGKKVAPPAHVSATGDGAATQLSPAQRLYPGMNP